MRIHQITYGMMMGDAVSNHVLAIDDRLGQWGYETHLYAQHIAPEMAGRVQPDSEFIPYLTAPDDLLVYHYLLYSPNIALFRAAQGRRLLIYHNITPPHFFARWDPNQAMLCDIGRRALSLLTDCDFALGDSDFNRRELVRAGFAAEKTAVLPIFLTLDHFESLPLDESLRGQLRRPGGINWLTVGRIVPNKGIEESIRIFYLYNQGINPQSRFYIVGSRYLSAYNNALDDLVDALGLTGQVVFTGRVSDSQLKTYYQTADLYLTASYHEGFCVPLIESMYFGVPILAHKATAIPETLGDAGILFTKLDYGQIAEMAHLVHSDEPLRQQIIAKQKERLLALQPAQAEKILSQVLQALVS